MTNIFNIMSIFIYLLFSLILFRNNRYWPFFFFFYVAQLWTIISCYYIEQGIFITEQERYSFETGATYRLVIQNLVFFASAIYTIKLLPKLLPIKRVIGNNLLHKKNLLFKICLYVIFINSILILLDAIMTYIKYNGLYSKFNYYQYSILFKFPFIRLMIFYVNLNSFLLGILFNYFEKNKKIRLLIFSALLFVLISNILQGSKFSALYLNLLLFFIPIFTRIKIKMNEKLTKYIMKFFVGIAIFGALVINLAIKEYSQTLSSNESFDFIVYRLLGLQGHVWWGTDYLSQHLNSLDKSSHLLEEIKVITLKSDGKYVSGLEALMLLVSPRLGPIFIDNNINFTMGFPALLNILFNPFVTLLVLMILGVFFGIFVYLFNLAIQSNNILIILLFGYIYIYGIMQFFTMGKTVQLFNLRMYIAFLILGYFSFMSVIIKELYRNKRSKII